MQFPESWLREFCNPPLTSQELADKLTMAGLDEARPFALAASCEKNHLPGLPLASIGGFASNRSTRSLVSARTSCNAKTSISGFSFSQSAIPFLNAARIPLTLMVATFRGMSRVYKSGGKERGAV